LADATDYPSADELPDLFSVTVDVRPMPAVGEFERLNVPAQLQQALDSRMAAQAEKQMQNAMNDLRDRLLQELERIATQLGRVGNGEKTKLYETLITNCKSLVDLARSMNLSGSQKLIELADKIESKLLSHPIEVYRNDVTRAKAVAQEAQVLITEAQSTDVWY
jgi:hypothetical protein